MSDLQRGHHLASRASAACSTDPSGDEDRDRLPSDEPLHRICGDDFVVVFSLTMMSTMNYNFDKLFMADDARGGWDVIVQENPNNPILELRSRLPRRARLRRMRSDNGTPGLTQRLRPAS
jgi:hypothetical protein